RIRFRFLIRIRPRLRPRSRPRPRPRPLTRGPRVPSPRVSPTRRAAAPMDERKLPFTLHLAELRTRLRNALIALLIACCVSFYFSEAFFALLARPLAEAFRLAGLKNPGLKFGSLTEPFWVYFELSVYAGVFLASPIIFHQLWKFIAPGLYDREKKIAVPFAACSALMFIGGAMFFY